MPYADSHVHLDRYPPQEAAAILARAHDAGVALLLNVGVDLDSSRRAAAIAKKTGAAGASRGSAGILPARAAGILPAEVAAQGPARPLLFSATGVHPRRLHTVSRADALTEIEAMLEARDAIAIGEVGLEYARDAAPPKEQQAFLRGCLAVAGRRDVAVSLHIVGAHEDALSILKQEGPMRAVVHYFQGDAALAARYLDAGCSVSVGKPVTRPENAALRESVKAIPLDRLLLETDTYPLPGRTTEPRDVVDVCRVVAALRGVAPEAIATATYRNLLRLLAQ